MPSWIQMFNSYYFFVVFGHLTCFVSLTGPIYSKPLTLTTYPTYKKRQSLFCIMFVVLFFFSYFISEPCLLMLGNSMHFKPLSIHVRESNWFQTFIYSRQGIQRILDPYLFTPVNPIYFRPLSTHIRESNLFHTLIYSCQGI